MSNFNTLKYRRSTDTLSPDTWFVYHDLGSKKVLVKEFSGESSDNEEQAKNLVKSMLMEEIEATIASLDETKKVPTDYLEQCIDEMRGLLESVEIFFSTHAFDIGCLKPLKGKVSAFSKEIKKLQRPYIAITDEDFATFEKSKANYYLTPTGKVVLWGGAGVKGGNTRYALMPLCHEEAEKVLAIN